ncbi:MAG: response regulator [Enhydrobacter sp.]|nr:response regulator [Enhydrobacter sp.]
MRRVLVVEDEVLVGMMIEEMLQDLGYELVALATHLDQALALARSESFDFALLDINLNGKQSFPVADVIRERGLPFLFATGYGDRILDAHYTGAPLLQKPFSLEELRRALKRAGL